MSRNGQPYPTNFVWGSSRVIVCNPCKILFGENFSCYVFVNNRSCLPSGNQVCKKIDSCPNGTSVLERIFEGISVYYNYTGAVDCFELDDDPHGMNGWNWQACTEMVMPMSCSKDSSMFPEYNYSYNAYREECLKKFRVKPRPTWITTEFGGHDFKTTLKMFGSNIIFSNGLLDPWSGGSVLEDISETIVALATEKGAHHLDLRAATADDPDWLVEQREAEIKLIERWLNDYYHDKKAVFDI